MLRDIKSVIQARLRTVHDRVANQMISDTTVFPYITYHLVNAPYQEGLYRFVLDVDVWDRPANGSTQAVDDLTDAVEKALDRYHQIDSKGKLTFYLTNILNPDSEDVTIRRNTLIFELQYRRTQNQ